VELTITHVRISVIFKGRYHAMEAESHCYAFATLRQYPKEPLKKAKVCTEDEFGFTKGFYACWSSHMRKFNATPPIGGWQKG